MPKTRKLNQEEDKRTRREKIEDEGGIVAIPDCSLPFLIHYLLEIGPIIAGPLGAVPIGWQDLLAWQICTSVQLHPWQCRLLVSLSKEYLSFQREAEDPNCPSPLLDEGFIASRRDHVSKALTLGFKGLIANQQKRKAKG